MSDLDNPNTRAFFYAPSEKERLFLQLRRDVGSHILRHLDQAALTTADAIWISLELSKSLKSLAEYLEERLKWESAFKVTDFPKPENT